MRAFRFFHSSEKIPDTRSANSTPAGPEVVNVVAPRTRGVTAFVVVVLEGVVVEALCVVVLVVPDVPLVPEVVLVDDVVVAVVVGGVPVVVEVVVVVPRSSARANMVK